MIYTIHAPLGSRDAETFKVIPESKAPWALIAPPVWLAFHKLWLPLLFYVVLSVFLIGLFLTPYWLVGYVLAGLPALYLLLEGNQLRRSALEDRGYQLRDVVDARDEDTALMRHLASVQRDSGASS